MSPPSGTVAAANRTSCATIGADWEWVTGATGAAATAVMLATAIPVAGTPACRQVRIRMEPPRIRGEIDRTECGRGGFNPAARCHVILLLLGIYQGLVRSRSGPTAHIHMILGWASKEPPSRVPKQRSTELPAGGRIPPCASASHAMPGQHPT